MIYSRLYSVGSSNHNRIVIGRTIQLPYDTCTLLNCRALTTDSEKEECTLHSHLSNTDKLKSSQNTKDNVDDTALQWARAHPVVAQACLDRPPIPVIPTPSQDCSTSLSIHSIKTLSDYLHWRQWTLPPHKLVLSTSTAATNTTSNGIVNGVFSAQDRTHATALISHVLSTPLTLAMHLLRDSASFTANLATPPLLHSDGSHRRWLMLGARAEASLPLDYWQELLLIAAAVAADDTDESLPNPHHSSDNTTVQQKASEMQPSKDLLIQMDMIGPDLVAQGSPSTATYGNFRMDIHAKFAGKYHDWKDSTNEPTTHTTRTTAARTYDAILLLNPGLGHAHLHKDWQPTLQQLFANEHHTCQNSTINGNDNDTQHLSSHTHWKQLLLTAHSEKDAQRDQYVLEHEYALTVPDYVENPWASQITYTDPFDAQHLVRPNHYVTLIQQQQQQ
jgi:hypothetical protein